MAGDASVPFSFAEVWEEESSRDKGRLRSRSREHQTYDAGGVARDVAEDDLLARLASAEGDILADEALIISLEETKATVAEINEQVYTVLLSLTHGEAADIVSDSSLCSR